MPSGARVADLGSGPGRDTALLRAHGFDAFCLDLSLGMLRAGVDAYPAERVQGDLLALPLRDDALGGVWANACLLHLSDEELPRALDEIVRVLRPGGCLHLTVKQGDGTLWEEARYGQPRWFQFWTAEALDAHLATARLEVRQAETRATSRDTWLVRQCTAP